MAAEGKLSELNAKSAPIGQWTVKVHGMRCIEVRASEEPGIVELLGHGVHEFLGELAEGAENHLASMPPGALPP